MRRCLAVATLVALLTLPLAACAPPSTPTSNTTTPSTPTQPTTPPSSTTTTPPTTTKATYTARLSSFNGSKVRGMALVTVNPSEQGSGTAGEATGSTGATGSTTTTGGAAGGTVIRVVIVATGMTADQMHAMHIHGFTTGTPSAIPPSASASNPTTEPVAENTYGPVLLPLEPFPTASSSGTVTYTKVLSAPAEVLTPSLENKAIVLHGMDVNGTYDPSVPVAVGILRLMTGKGGEVTGTVPGGESSGTTSSP
jgi:hypothetical protein